MLILVNQVLSLIPFKISSLFHVYIFYLEWLFVNINIWLLRGSPRHNAFLWGGMLLAVPNRKMLCAHFIKVFINFKDRCLKDL